MNYSYQQCCLNITALNLVIFSNFFKQTISQSVQIECELLTTSSRQITKLREKLKLETKKKVQKVHLSPPKNKHIV